MKIIPIHPGAAIAVQLYVPKATDDPFEAIMGPSEEVELGARKLIEAMDEHWCVAFLEALILESKKAINRHAVFCEKHNHWKGADDWYPPEWARKYADVGL